MLRLVQNDNHYHTNCAHIICMYTCMYVYPQDGNMVILCTSTAYFMQHVSYMHIHTQDDNIKFVCT